MLAARQKVAVRGGNAVDLLRAFEQRLAMFAEDLVPRRGNQPDEFAKFIAADTDKWGRVIRDAGIPLQD